MKQGFQKQGILLTLALSCGMLFLSSCREEEKGTVEMKNQSSKNQTAGNQIGVIETSYGKIKFEFYSDDAPKTVERIKELISSGFYNGLTFHRVVPGFVVQGGDPQGNGTGGSGMNLKAEFKNQKHKHLLGTFAMARSSDPDSADSQFYICLAAQPRLDGQYTVFGQTIEGVEIISKIKIGDKMTKVYLEEKK